MITDISGALEIEIAGPTGLLAKADEPLHSPEHGLLETCCTSRKACKPLSWPLP